MDKVEFINGYFEGSLSEKELEEFNNLLKTDEDFFADFEFQKELQLSLKKEERREIKQMFNEITETEKPNTPKVIRLRPLMAAASIALLVGLGSWFFLFNKPNYDTNQLYNTHFVPYDNVVHPIERGNQLVDLKTRAFTAYENEEYVVALELFKELHTEQSDSYIDFYTAIVLMQLQNHKEAIPLLKGYIENDGALKGRASWYLALSYLKTGAWTKSKEQLNIVVINNSYKADEARKLLEALE